MGFLTPFFVGFVLLLNVVLGRLELAWFGADGPAGALAAWSAFTALFDSLFLIIILAAGGLLGCLVFPVFPVLLLIYFGGKTALYGAVLPDPFGSLLLLAVAHAVVTLLLMASALAVNPTWENMTRAIETGRNRRLAVMLRLRFGLDDTPGRLVLGALQSDNVGAVRKLARHGADGDVDYWIRIAGTSEMQWLIVKSTLDRDGNTARVGRYAADFGIDELRCCLERGVPPRRRGRLMHSAIEEQSMQQADVVSPAEYQAIIDKLKLLLDHGADVDSPSHHGDPPLMTALHLHVDMTPVLRFLLGRGAAVNARSKIVLYPRNRGPLPVGVTALMLAVLNNRPAEVQALLEHGADVSLRDADGKTAADYATGSDADADAVRALLSQATSKPGPARPDSAGV